MAKVTVETEVIEQRKYTLQLDENEAEALYLVLLNRDHQKYQKDSRWSGAKHHGHPRNIFNALFDALPVKEFINLPSSTPR